jgi:hypothetical protein
MIFRYDEKITANGFALFEEADFEAQNYPPALTYVPRTTYPAFAGKLHFTIEPTFLPNACVP